MWKGQCSSKGIFLWGKCFFIQPYHNSYPRTLHLTCIMNVDGAVVGASSQADTTPAGPNVFGAPFVNYFSLRINSSFTRTDCRSPAMFNLMLPISTRGDDTWNYAVIRPKRSVLYSCFPNLLHFWLSFCMYKFITSHYLVFYCYFTNAYTL